MSNNKSHEFSRDAKRRMAHYIGNVIGNSLFCLDQPKADLGNNAVLSLVSVYFINMKNESRWQDFLVDNFQDLKISDIKKLRLKDICNNGRIEDISFCITYNHLNIVKKIDFTVIILSSGILGFVWLLGKLGKQSRSILYFLFKSAYFLVNFLLIFILILNSFIFAGTIYYIIRVFFERLAIGFVIVTGLACLIGIVRIVSVLLLKLYKSELTVFAVKADIKKIESLRNTIRSIEAKLNNISIINVLFGIEPNFFVTNSKVRCKSGIMHNGTLYLSLPLLRNLKTEELLAILAHEYAHVAGKDTFYAEKFYKLYRGIE